MENITASELAGFGVGGILVAVAVAIPKVDSFIATSQRRSLGLCENCGGVKAIPCPKCKGLGHKLKEPCKYCNSKGRFTCKKMFEY